MSQNLKAHWGKGGEEDGDGEILLESPGCWEEGGVLDRDPRLSPVLLSEGHCRHLLSSISASSQWKAPV